MTQKSDKIIQYIRDDLKRIENKVDKFDEKLDKHVRSHGQDRETLRIYLKEGYVSKQEFIPIKSLYDKVTNFALGAIVVIGTVTLGAFIWLRDKFGKLP